MNSRTPPQSISNDSFADSAPSSDNDPYDGANQSINFLDRTNFPKPMPIFGPLFGFNDKRFSVFLQTRVATAKQILDRPPTQEEVAALAYYTAKYISVISYGGPLGMAGGLWRAYGTKSTFRFPLFQPNLEKFKADVFPTARIPALKGLWAVMAWHLVRGMAYGTMGNIIGQIFFASYATSVSVVGELQDPRLKQFHEAIKKRGRESAEKRQGTLQGVGQQGQMRGQQPQAQQSEMQDDGSPTAGMYGRADMTPTPETYETTPQPSPPRGQFPQRRPVPTEAPAKSSESSPFDIIDDASPTGGQGIYGNTTASQPQGSAWERLRRGEKPASIPTKTTSSSNPGVRTQQQMQAQREQREGATLGDSYTFSKSDEERSYAKDEAQKEFDARIERERRGGDFNAGGNRKW
ncbi:uncharacterized protein PAC_10752 [Phialocephala subalpina]|uniref:Uncharacterized protein n=1 Tax=Phialocephala subalpina TaxID=576137 RepID=A0A1L7X758_9HELO|nr:uncharacterized protein PAC_10752 [Phialocephala subalpina]